VKNFRDEVIQSAFLDRWTIPHIGAGFVVGKFLQKDWPKAIPLFFVFEWLENLDSTRRFLRMFGFRGKETADNVASDIIFDIVGLWLGSRK